MHGLSTIRKLNKKPASRTQPSEKTDFKKRKTRLSNDELGELLEELAKQIEKELKTQKKKASKVERHSRDEGKGNGKRK